MNSKMLFYILKRVLLALLTIWIVITVTFFVMHSIPGGPFASEKAISAEAQAALEAKYGLDKPLGEQYVTYLRDVVTKLDFGPSLKQRGRQVIDIILDGMKTSAKLGLIAAFSAAIAGIVLGALAALRRNTVLDKIIMVITTAFVSMPSFIMGSFLLIVFSVKLGWVPANGATAEGLILPIITLALYPMTIITLLEGGNAGSSQVYFYTVEQTVTLPTPTRTGYTFLGWTGEGITTPQPNVTIPKGSTGDKRYIENWELTEYNITMDLNGGSGQEKVVYTMTDEDFELPTPTRNGYEFVGWTGEGITTPQTSVKIPKGSTGNKAYTANWKVIEYTITLDTNGGPVVSPIKYTVEDTFTLPYILRPGYEFAGWTLDGSGMLPFTPLIIYPGTTGNLHYKAEWRLAEYTITMDLDGGSGQEKVVYTITDEEFELPTPTRNGYEFVGWTGEGITTPQTSVKIPKGSTGNKAYTANWKVIRYTITLVTNGGAVIASIRYTVEDSVTLPIPPERPGYEFSGWVLDGSGQFPSTPMIIPKGSTGDLIYKAEWRVATYTITYVSHGKAYNWVQYTINNQVYFGTPEEDPSYYLPGYTFVGWKIDGVSGTPHSYMLPKGSYGNRTATMLWEPIP